MMRKRPRGPGQLPLDSAPEADEEFQLQQRPRIPEGDYVLNCLGGEVVRFSFGRRALLHFQIVGGEYQGIRLFLAMTAPEKGAPVPLGSKLWRTALLARNGHPLERRERFSFRDFKGLSFLGTVRNATPREDGDQVYSVVDALLKRLES